MPDLRQRALKYALDHRTDFLDTLKDLIAIPSISTDPERKNDLVRTAEWLSAKLKSIGAESVEIYPTAGHPVVFGEIKTASPDAQTVLIYGHYDVQPPDPFDQWKTPPFVPSIKGEDLYARGASDMKGQILVSISAIEAILAHGTLPVNVKFLLEGEEEIGSPHLSQFMEEHKELLACDVALNPDACMISKNVPTIVSGLRGLAYFEIRVYGPAHDLHSGLFGGIVHNPAQVLCELVAGMHAKDGKITLPGFYDQVVPLTSQERAHLAALPMNDQFYLDQTGVPALWGESGFTSVERAGARPTLDVNGFYAGFINPGSKTVIPAYAMAKVSMRLVPDQDPVEVHKQLVRYMESNAPKTVRWEVIPMSGGPACKTNINHPATKALHAAMQEVWGVEPAYKREGGSIPIVSDMQAILNIDSVLTGFGLPEDNVHAPNEKLNLPTWYRGIDTLIHFFLNLAPEK